MRKEVEKQDFNAGCQWNRKFTGRLLKAAISKYMAHCKEKKLQKQRSRDAPVTPHGKQTVKQLIGRIRGSPILRSQTLPSRNLRESPGNMVETMR